MNERNQKDTTRQIARREDWPQTWHSPFEMLRRMVDPFEGGLRPSLLGFPSRGPEGEFLNWSPQIEAFQRGDEFVVRADLPGLEKKDVTVEVRDDCLVIDGERSKDYEKEEEGYYSSERTYGRFHRTVPIPEGAIADSVKASFKNGVLEVMMKAPPREASRGRRVDISG
jgi:HSP20 family protein